MTIRNLLLSLAFHAAHGVSWLLLAAIPNLIVLAFVVATIEPYGLGGYIQELLLFQAASLILVFVFGFLAPLPE